MRLLVSLVGPDGGVLVGDDRGTARKALTEIPHDAVHLLTVDPGDEEIDRVRALVERSGARFEVDAVDADAIQTGDLQAAFEAILEAIEAHREADDPPSEIHVQVNAGRHANLLSAAGLLACLHTGVPAHFVHEEGHTALPVLTRAPLDDLLDDDEHAALVDLPDEGIPLTEASEHDPGALNGLKDRGLVERDGDRLVATDQGRAYREHLRRRARARE